VRGAREDVAFLERGVFRGKGESSGKVKGVEELCCRNLIIKMISCRGICYSRAKVLELLEWNRRGGTYSRIYLSERAEYREVSKW